MDATCGAVRCTRFSTKPLKPGFRSARPKVSAQVRLYRSKPTVSAPRRRRRKLRVGTVPGPGWNGCSRSSRRDMTTLSSTVLRCWRRMMPEPGTQTLSIMVARLYTSARISAKHWTGSISAKSKCWGVAYNRASKSWDYYYRYRVDYYAGQRWPAFPELLPLKRRKKTEPRREDR